MKSIADVVSGSGLAGYAEIALVLFFGVFIVVGLKALLSDGDAIDRAAQLPFEDDRAIRDTTTHSQPPVGRVN